MNRTVKSFFNTCFFLILFISLLISGCKKQKTSIGTLPVPSIPKKVDLLPNLIRVRYQEGSSGVESCAKCHKSIYEEWKKSFHAQSAISHNFITETKNYEFEDCISCHSPLSLGEGITRPESRKWLIHEGITCSSCHVKDDRTHANLSSNAPHGTFKNPLYSDSKICQSCHQPTYTQWKESSFKEQAISCQGCHMPIKNRHISEHSKHVYTKKDSHDHSFSIDFKDIVDLKINAKALQPEQIIVRLKNKGAGHNLPTGIYGDSAVFLDFRILDGENTLLFREEKLNARQGNAIKPGEERKFFFNFLPAAKKSYLMVAKVYFTSSNYEKDIKIAEVSQYWNP